MAEDPIDFSAYNKKILISPVVPLQMLDIFCRNRVGVQATLFGKVYSNSVEILEVVPVGRFEANNIYTIDFTEHQKLIENITTVYETLQIVGVVTTGKLSLFNVGALHSMYAKKQSGFKPQGILNYPLIVSVDTVVDPQNGFNISAYMLNQSYLFCRDVLEVTAFERLKVQISLGDCDLETATPLFDALNDQQQLVPSTDPIQLKRRLIVNLTSLKSKLNEQDADPELAVKLRQLVDQLVKKETFDSQEFSYLLDVAVLENALTTKLRKFQTFERKTEDNYDL